MTLGDSTGVPSASSLINWWKRAFASASFSRPLASLTYSPRKRETHQPSDSRKYGLRGRPIANGSFLGPATVSRGEAPPARMPGEFAKEFAKPASGGKNKARRNLLSRRALRCRGDWIRTSDLLNPIKAVSRRKSPEKTNAPALTTFHTLQHLQ